MTAEEFLKSKEPNTFIVPEEWLVEFAKRHLKNFKEELKTETDKKSHQTLEMIYNVYTMKNIK